MNEVLYAQSYLIKKNKCDMEKIHDGIRAEHFVALNDATEYNSVYSDLWLNVGKKDG
jgi:hypothetical protein